jgi:hypothetical protein
LSSQAPPTRASSQRTPTSYALRGRIGGLVTHSRHDSRELTAPGRAAFRSKFEREVDPNGELDPVERAKRADCARRAFYARIALKSAQVRATKKAPAASTTITAGAEGIDDAHVAEPLQV